MSAFPIQLGAFGCADEGRGGHWRGEISNRTPDEHRQLRWFAARDLDSLPLAHPTYPALLGDALVGRR
jgi:hypothetical protein